MTKITPFFQPPQQEQRRQPSLPLQRLFAAPSSSSSSEANSSKQPPNPPKVQPPSSPLYYAKQQPNPPKVPPSPFYFAAADSAAAASAAAATTSSFSSSSSSSMETKYNGKNSNSVVEPINDVDVDVHEVDVDDDDDVEMKEIVTLLVDPEMSTLQQSQQDDEQPRPAASTEIQQEQEQQQQQLEKQQQPQQNALSYTFYNAEDLEELKRFTNDLKDNVIEYVIPIADIQKGVSSDRIMGAALTGAFVGLLVSHGIVLSSAVGGLSAAYLAISKGITGDVLRTVGGIAWNVTDTAARLLNIVVNNEKLSLLSQDLAQSAVEALWNIQRSATALIQANNNKKQSSSSAALERISLEQAYLDSQEELKRVLEEAEAAIEGANMEMAQSPYRISEQKDVMETYHDDDDEMYDDVSLLYHEPATTVDYEQPSEPTTTDPITTFQSAFVADEVELPVQSKQDEREDEEEEAAAAEGDQTASEALEDAPTAVAAAPAKVEEEIAVTIEEEEETALDDKTDDEPTTEATQSPAVGEVTEASRTMVEEAETVADVEKDADDNYMDEEDFLAAVELAQEGLDGKIVGVEDAIADTFARAKWDAAGNLAKELQQDDAIEEIEDNDEEDDDDDDDILLGAESLEGLDLEALGKAAREAVDMFEKMGEDFEEQEDKGEVVLGDEDEVMFEKMGEEYEEEEEGEVVLGDGDEGEKRYQDWSQLTPSELRAELQRQGLRLNDYDSADIDFAGLDMEELGRQAREAVKTFQSGSGDLDDEEPTEEMLAALENEMTINSRVSEEESKDFSEMTVAQLKEECRRRGLKVSGRKAELIERLETGTD